MADNEMDRKRKAAAARKKADEALIKKMRAEQKRRDRAKRKQDAAVLKAFRDGQKAEARRRKIAEQNRKKK